MPIPSSFAYADVVIQIDDVNDHRPTFDQSVYSFEIDENKPKGFIISQQLKATDNDATVGFDAVSAMFYKIFELYVRNLKLFKCSFSL